MTMLPEQRTKIGFLLGSWIIALLVLSPWIYVQSQAMLNGNVTWLLIAADRMIHGGTMAQTIYETNPPLSIMLYAPHIIFMQALNLPPEIGPFIMTIFMILLSLLASSKILKTFEYLNPLERQTFLIAQTATLTCMSAIYFMDREHLMLTALIPFLLAQTALTERRTLSAWLLWPVMIVGALAILIKPHYGLLPAALLLHRMACHRSLKVMLHPDFLTLAIATVTYVAIVIFAFPDYVQIILPDVFSYYLGESDKPQTFRLFKPHFATYLVLLILEACLGDLDKPKKKFLILIYICALLALVPLLMQMKGFYNHLLPAFGLSVIAVSLSIIFRTERWLGSKSTKFLPLLVPIAILGFMEMRIKPAWNFPKGYEIASMPVAKFLDENCPQPCTFFAFHGDIETINPTSFYTGYKHGTRFPSYWFLPRMLEQMELAKKEKPSTISPEKLDKDRDKYALFAAQDLEQFKPDILLIGTNIDILGKGEFFNYVDFFSSNESFRKTLSENYEKTGNFKFDRAEYFRGTSLGQTLILTYDVYKRKN